LQEKLAPRILHSLQEIRLKITDDDRISDLIQMLLCPLKQLIPKNEQVAKTVQKTESGTINQTSNDIVGSPRAKAYKPDPNTVMPPASAIKMPKVRKFVSKPSVNRVNTQNDFPRDGFQPFLLSSRTME
jgi:hypothetical protein